MAIEERAFTRLLRRVDLLERRKARKGHSHVAKARDSGTGNAIGTSEATFVSVTLTIPSEWATYDIEAIVTGNAQETGTLTQAQFITLRLRKDSVSGTQLSSQIVALNTAFPANHLPYSFIGFSEGETATGSVQVHATDIISGDTAQVSNQRFELVATAFRTS